MSDTFSVSVDFLLGLSPDRLPDAADSDPRESELLFSYRALSSPGKIKLARLLKDLLASEREKLAPQKLFCRRIPLYDLPVSAGPGEFLESESYRLIDVAGEVPPSADFALRISGDSMEPLFSDGGTIYLERCEAVESGRIGVFILNGSAYLKRLRLSEDTAFLVSLNPKYPPIEVKASDSLSCVGQVLRS